MVGRTGDCLRYKGKFIKKKQLNKKHRSREAARNLRKVSGMGKVSNLQNDKDSKIKQSQIIIEGRRIIHLESVRAQLICDSCDSKLDFFNVVSEQQFGLASRMTIQCNECPAKKSIYTDKQHDFRNERGKMSKHFDLNTKIALGALHTGIGNTHINKILSILNIKEMHAKTFKEHEHEVGRAAEQQAIVSCRKAAVEEKRLSLENLPELESMLPSHLDMSFILPRMHETGPCNQNTAKLRIAASYDMGWTTRSTGRNYDSLTGYGALIGLFTKKVISYEVQNRKCRQCELGVSPEAHDCRKNCVGSAKSMEAKAAVKLVVENPILQDNNLELGFIINDNDSSTIAALRNAAPHEIVKQDDTNHLANGIGNELFKMQKKCKELTSGAIQYLKTCFKYCVAQNCKDAVAMSANLRVIPNHCFNDHATCGDWCGFIRDPDNYKHQVIGDGFTDPKLFEALVRFFDSLAAKTHRFACGVSSNVNESLNHMITSKAPKTQMYGTSASGDYRVAMAVNQENECENYIIPLLDRLNVSPGKNAKKPLDSYSRKHEKRTVIRKSREFKKRRLFLKNERKNLRNQAEVSEGSSYQSNICLTENVDVFIPLSTTKENSETSVVFYDLETGSFARDCDILQIAAKGDDRCFSVYIKPTQKISSSATDVNGLQSIEGNLCLHSQVVPSVSLFQAMQDFYSFLFSFEKKIILVAHNDKFDRPRLVKSIQKSHTTKYFSSLIYGFVDSLPIIRSHPARQNNKSNKLGDVCSDLNIRSDNAHNAINDVNMLEQIIIKLGITFERIAAAMVSWEKAQETLETTAKYDREVKKFSHLNKCLSTVMKKKIIAENISVEMITAAFKTRGLKGLSDLLGVDENGVIRVTRNQGVIQRLYDHLEATDKNCDNNNIVSN